MQRGGAPQLEIQHGRELLSRGAEDTWGWNTPAGQERVRARISWITRACGLAPGVRALECGCGTGMFTRRLAKTGASIVAADISEELLSEARNHCPASNVEFVQCNLEAPDNLSDAAFDALYGVSVLHHLALPATLQALQPKLAPGGRFAFSEPNLDNPINRYLYFTPDQEKRRKYGVSPNEMAFRLAELNDHFHRSGFVVESIAYRDFMHPKVPDWAIGFMRGAQFVAERLPLVRSLSGSLWVSGRKA